jgi:hypothetical protein
MEFYSLLVSSKGKIMAQKKGTYNEETPSEYKNIEQCDGGAFRAWDCTYNGQPIGPGEVVYFIPVGGMDDFNKRFIRNGYVVR